MNELVLKPKQIMDQILKNMKNNSDDNSNNTMFAFENINARDLSAYDGITISGGDDVDVEDLLKLIDILKKEIED
jgi:hypothetical protein